MIFVNKLVARLLNTFSRPAKRGTIAQPASLVQQAIVGLPKEEGYTLNEHIGQLNLDHEDAHALQREFPHIAGTRLLDLGSGNGYLGGWLQGLGVSYTGVEPSSDLVGAAKNDKRLDGASLIEASLRDFCERDLYPHEEPPTLVTIIGVMDLLAEPEASLYALFEFFRRRRWKNVPVLVATFDADFFLPGLPTARQELQTSCPYGVPETLMIRDPAAWEEMFANNGFHLLEQRPLHISGLPKHLSNHLQELHKQLFESMPPLTGRGEDGDRPAAAAYVPPRQGPFYFWLLCSRNVDIHPHEGTPGPETIPAPTRTEVYADAEELAVVGNLGTRTYRTLDGSASFVSGETGHMEFGKDTLFGQLETSCNYFASRMLGRLTAKAGSRFETIENRQTFRYLVESGAFPDKLFVSLLQHLDSVQFVPYASAKRVDSNTSQVLSGEPYSVRFVQNVVAYLLQAAARAVANEGPEGFRSRVLIEMDMHEFGVFVYGRDYKRAPKKLLDILPPLVQSNVIDSFACRMLLDSGVEEDVTEANHIDKQIFSPLNIGWQAARYVDYHFPPLDPQGNEDDLYTLALAISSYLRSDSADKALQAEFKSMAKSEAMDKKMEHASPGRSALNAIPKTDLQRLEYVVRLVGPESQADEQLRDFLSHLRKGFDYSDKNSFSRGLGLSNFIVIRDVWALVACLLDRPDIWHSPTSLVSVIPYTQDPRQRPRITAYIQECIAYAGRQAGFKKAPW
jgi:SAM-dependent methyltransferase